MALSCDPKLLLADEPTTALDVTIQAQVLEVMARLSRELGTSVIVITHNLGVVARYADRVNVMYGGRIVESGEAADIYARPKHAYTLGLLESVPRLDARTGRLIPIEGTPPRPDQPPRRMFVRAALPLRDRPLPRRASGADRVRPWPPRRLLELGRPSRKRPTLFWATALTAEEIAANA